MSGRSRRSHGLPVYRIRPSKHKHLSLEKYRGEARRAGRILTVCWMCGKTCRACLSASEAAWPSDMIFRREEALTGPTQAMLSVGQTVGSYRITRQLGEGAMGQVFEGLQEEIGKRVALKVLHPHLAQFPEAVNRFLNEARAVNLIGHPSLVTIFESGRLPDGAAYIVMEYLEGETLSARIQNGALTIADTMRLGRQIASALQAAHEKGIVHRDLKPENVFVVRDPEAASGERAKILDFGIAKLSEEQQGKGALVKTAAGTMLGTPLYMSPEQCDGNVEVDGKSDVYSLGILLFEMLTGEPPFSGLSINAVMLKHVSAPVPHIRDRNPLVPDALGHLLRRMMAKDIVDRPTMVDVANDLEALLSQVPAARSGASLDALAPTLAIVRQTGDGAPAARASLGSRAADGDPVAVRGAVPLQPVRSSVGPVAPASEAGSIGQSPVQSTLALRKRPVWIGVSALVLAAVAGALWLGRGLLFAPKKVRLQVATQGDVDAGRVTSIPVGIDCGYACSERFPKGSRIHLTATPAPGYEFAGWSGDCSDRGPCSLQLRWDQEVQARFVRQAAAPQRPSPPALGGTPSPAQRASHKSRR